MRSAMTRHLAAAREEQRVGSLFAPLLSTLGTIFAPVHLVFQYVFYQPVFNVLMLVYAGVHSFALSIVILTLLIRSALIPLTRRQLRSSKVMQELAPQLNELKAQHKDDPQGMMAAQQALYKEHGVSLYGGCLPLLVQLPFLYALYYSFFAVLTSQAHETITHHLSRVNADIYPFLPHLTTLPATNFFWTSLAHPDPLHILPALAGILTFIQLRMSLPVRAKNQPRAASAGPDPSQSMQIMQYIMPIITFTIGLSFPAGLALYWCITTGFSAVQQYFISGWGSLFVGVPGMERFVPPPKVLTPPTTSAPPKSRGLTPTSSARSSLTGPNDSSPQAGASGGGIGGFFQRLMSNASAQAAAAQKATEEAAAAKQRDLDEQRAARRAANSANGANGSSNGNVANGANGNGGANGRRQRPAKAGPTLVKPPTTSTEAPTETPSAASALSDVRPEVALARDAGSRIQGKAALPEQAIARDGMNGKNGVAAGSSTPVATAKPASVSAPKGAGSNGASKSNGSNGANGANGANGSRAGASAKNSQPQRPRSNGAASRPKGGR